MPSAKMLLFTKLATPKVPKKRSRAGCTFCKDKRKKCDEIRPACGRCLETGENCQYDPNKPRQPRKIDVSMRKHPVPSDEVVVSPSIPQDGLDPSVFSTGNTTVVKREPTDVPELSAPPVPSSAIIRDGPSAKYTLLATDTFDLDGYGPPRAVCKVPRLTVTDAMPIFPSMIEFSPPVFSEFSHKYQERMLMNHFCNTLSHLIVLREDEGNPFQQLVLPLTHNSSAVQNAMFALTSAHLEAKGVEALQNEGKSVHYHNEAICSLAKVIKKGNGTNTNELLATIILLVYYEVLVQKRRSNLVEGHLKGAMAIMRNGQVQKDRTSVFLDRAFRFYDVIAALSFGTAPVSDDPTTGGFMAFEPMDSRGATSPHGSIDALLGLATPLWPVIHKLSGLVVLKKQVEGASGRGDFSEAARLRDELDTACASVESVLTQWQPILPVDCDVNSRFEELSKTTQDKLRQLQSVSNTALAYRYSALVYLYRTIHDCSRDVEIVQHHTHASLVHCEATVRHGGPMGALLWPLFVASCEASSLDDRFLASKAFSGIGQRQGMTNINRSWQIVQEVWQHADSEKFGDAPLSAGGLSRRGKDLWRRVSEDMGITVVFG